ncbi:MAG: hydrogenase nickel incorporation protein HypB [Polyangiaceae bacterium]
MSADSGAEHADHAHGHEHHAHDHDHHDHEHAHEHSHVGADGQVYWHRHVDESPQTRLVRVEQDLLATNNRFAEENRRRFTERGTLVVNLMSSPGSGKTTLLVRTLTDQRGRYPMAVVEGDQQTRLDADRIEKTGVPAIQINTGKGCHLDARMLADAIQRVDPPARGVMFVENVGNLVCPAGFDLGEHKRVVVFSAPEGEDKPLKYPDMFATADLVLINKVDLLPHLGVDRARMIDNVRRVRPSATILEVSATTGAGLEAFYEWLDRALAERIATST